MTAQQAESPPLLIDQQLMGALERCPHREVFSRKRIQRRSLVGQVRSDLCEYLIPMMP
jgi:hypothetical protein